MRLVLFLTVAVFLARPCAAQSTTPQTRESPPLQLTERDAVARLLENDPRLRAIGARVEQVRAAQADRAMWPNPSAMFTRESVFDTEDTFFLIRQELPISGRRDYLQTAGRRAVDAAEADARFERLQLQAEVRNAYTSLLLAQRREGAIQEAMAGLEKLIAVLRAREAAGEGSLYDRMRGERALADLEAERELARADRAQAQGRLAGYLGPGTADVVIATDSLAPPPLPAPLSALIEQALANRGEYRASQRSIERFEAERSAAARLKIPTPSLTAGLKQSAVGGVSHSGYQFSVDLSLPLINYGQPAAALASAHKTQAEADTESWRLRIEAEVRTAHRVVRILQERAARYQESASRIAEPLARIGRVGYEEGELSILELLDAERQLLGARLQVLELVAQARRAAIELDRVTGQEFRP